MGIWKSTEQNKKLEHESTGSPVQKAKISGMGEHSNHTILSNWKDIYCYMPKCMNIVQPFSLKVLSL